MRQTATAVSSAASPHTHDAEDILRILEDLAGILKVDPEHQNAVQPAMDLIKKKVIEIDRLREALLKKGYYIAKIHWLRCLRRGVVRSYKEEKTVSYLSMSAAIRTDGPVKLAKPPSGKRKGELDLSSEEQTRIFNAA